MNEQGQGLQNGVAKRDAGDSDSPNTASPGYKELINGMNALKSTVTSQLQIPPAKSGQKKSSKLKVQYAFKAQFSLALETDWEVCKGFTLEGIVLHMAAEMTNEKDSAALRVRLEAYATIGDFEFQVTAEIPNIQNGMDLNIIFELKMRLPATPDDVSKALQTVTGGGDQHNASSIVDDSLKNQMRRDRMGAILQLRITKPANRPNLRFNSLVFRFYGQIHWKPKLKASEIDFELVDGDFVVVLAKNVSRQDSPLLITARLYGNLLVGSTRVSAAVAFSRDEKLEKRIQFELQVLSNGLSARSFLDELPTTKDGKQNKLSGGNVLSSLELPSSFSDLSKDLSSPKLRLQLTSSYSLTKSELEYLQFNVFARDLAVFPLGFIDDAQLRDLVVRIELKSWSILVTGKLLLGKYVATLQLIFIKGKGISVQGSLAPESDCSLATLARMDIFNDKAAKESMNVAGRAKEVNTGGNPPIDLSRGVRTRGTQLSFDMLVLYQKDEKSVSKIKQVDGDQKNPTTTSNGTGSADQDVVKEDGSKDSLRKDSQPEPGYHIQHIKFLSHFDLDWQIIEDKVKFENLGICFDVRNPRETAKRKMAGLLYATWKLSTVELFVYLLGKKDSKNTDFWAGLNIKKTNKDSSKKALDIINDPKFTGSSESDSKLALPVKLPADLQAKPEDQTLKTGLEFDGRLLVHFSKNKEEDKSYVFQDLSLHVDLEAPFTISGYDIVGSLLLDLRIKYPMIKEKRDFSCYLKGGLKFDNGFYMSIEADIPVNNKKQLEEKTPTTADTEKEQKLTSSIEKMKLSPSARKTNVQKYLGNIKVNDEDMVFLAKVGKSEPPISSSSNDYESRLSSVSDSDDKSTKHDTSFRSFVTSSYQPSEGTKSGEDAVKDLSPEGNPVISDKYQTSTHFAVALVVRRVVKESKSERKVKALAATLTSTEKWSIITDRLWIQDAGLSVILLYDDQQKKSISGVIQGTIVLKDVAALATRITYVKEILTITAVAEINLTTLFTSMDTEQTETPDLTDTLSGDKNDKLLMVGVEAEFKKTKLQSYRVDVLVVPDFSIIDGITLQAIWFNIKHDRSKEIRTTDMTLGGRLLLNNQVVLTIEGTSGKTKTAITWEAHKLSPAKIAAGLVEGGLNGSDGDNTKPDLPANTGFSDWDADTKSDAQTSGEVVFIKENGKRRFDSATLEVALVKTTAEDSWDLIDNYIRLKKFVLLVSITTVNKKKILGVGLKAEFYLTERSTKTWSTTPDALQLVCTKSDLTLTINPKPGRTIGDIIWCVTSGFLDIPSNFDIPAFPLLKISFNWKTKEAELNGYFTSDQESWKVPYLEYVAKINKPSIRGTIKKKGNSSTRVSIAGKLAFLNDLVELDCEYVLMTGPFFVEGHDVKKYYDMVKKIWNAVKKALDALRKAGKVVGEAATAVVEVAGAAIAAGSAAIGAAIGGLLGALAVGGEFLAGVGAFLVGGLLGGAAWLAAKSSIVGLLKIIGITDGHDTEKLVDGFLGGVSPHENEDAKGKDGSPEKGPQKRGDDKSTTVAPKGKEESLKRINVDKDSFIELTGSATCAGVEDQLTEFYLEYKPRKGVFKRTLATVSQLRLVDSVQLIVEYQSKSNQPVGAISPRSAPFRKTFDATKALQIGKRYRIPWLRPSKSTTDSYTVSLVVTKTDGQVISKQQWEVDLIDKPEQGFSPDQTVLDVPSTLATNADLLGYIFLKDPKGNLRQGVDDRSRLKIEVTPKIQTRLSLLQNGYKLYATSPIQDGEYAITLKAFDRTLTAKTKVAPITTFDSLIIQGSGVASGKAKESDLAIVVIDTYQNITNIDHLTAVMNQSDIRTEITMSQGTTDLTNTVYTGKYTRPIAGKYTIRVLVNDYDVAGSPFNLISTDEDASTASQKKLLTIPRARLAAKDVQNILVDFYDSFGASRSQTFDPLRGWQLQAIPVDEEDNELSSSQRLPLGPLELTPILDLVRYKVKAISITSIGKYKLALLGPAKEGQPQDQQLFDNHGSDYLTITPERVVTSFLVSGDGLQTGWENSDATVNFQALDQYGRDMLLTNSTVNWTIISADGKIVHHHNVKVNYEAGYFTYQRPKVNLEGGSEAYSLRITLNTPNKTLEAPGSPYVVRSESYFDDINFIEKSFWLKDRFIPNQPSWATLFVRDTYTVLTRVHPSLYIVESNDYNIKSVIERADGTYRVLYTAQSSAVNFGYYLDGLSFTEKTLPSTLRPVWEPVEKNYESPLRLLKLDRERLVARYTSKDAIEVSNFTAMIFEEKMGTGTFFALTRIVPDSQRQNTYCVWATINKTGIFTLRPSYRGLPLGFNPRAHDIRIEIEIASYLHNGDDDGLLTPVEREWASSPLNVTNYIQGYLLGAPLGNPGAKTLFNILPSFPPTTPVALPTSWPVRFVFTMTPVDNDFYSNNSSSNDEHSASLPPENEADWRITRLSLLYPIASPTGSATSSSSVQRLTYGKYTDTPTKDVSVPLSSNERIVKARVITLPDQGWVAGIVLETNQGKKYEIPEGCGYEKSGYESVKPEWCAGLKGFWGSQSEEWGVERLGVVWSK